jgi:DNA-binding FadR family transcriptional regulator
VISATTSFCVVSIDWELMRHQPSNRKSLPTTIAEEIALRILAGEFPPGSVLPNEQEWMRLFEVSRPALREAVRLLAAKGLVSSRPRLGTTVREKAAWTTLDADMLRWLQRSMDVAEFVRHVMTIRAMIEPPAAALAAANASPDQVLQLQALAQKIDAAEETPEKSQAADVAFHRQILLASGNPLLAGLGACIEEALRATIALTRPKAEARRTDLYWNKAMRQHKDVVAAIAARDGARAKAMMEELLQTTAEHVRNILDANTPST